MSNKSSDTNPASLNFPLRTSNIIKHEDFTEITKGLLEQESDSSSFTEEDVIENSTDDEKLGHIDKLNQDFTASMKLTKSQSTSSTFNAPVWIYGTTVPSRNASSANSGLCLSERGQVAIAQPEVIQNFLYPITETLQNKIITYRKNVLKVLSRKLVKEITEPSTHENTEQEKRRILVVTGPTFITDPNQAKACAQWVGSIIGKQFNNLPALLPDNIKKIYEAKRPVPQRLLMSMRTNLNKYNFGYGDPALKHGANSLMTFEIQHGIPICRALLCELAEICPVVGELSDTITPQYLADLLCLGIVSSTLIESQLHRELVSGISFPVGFHTCDSYVKTVRDFEDYIYKIDSALDAIYASANQHQFLSISKIGTVAVVGTIGNSDTFIILQFNQELLSLDFSNISSIIDRVYNHPKVKIVTPRIMIDIGKISNSNFDTKYTLLDKIFKSDDIKDKILGVMIDSGDHYIPTGFNFELKEHEFGAEYSSLKEDVESSSENYTIEDLLNHDRLVEINRYFVKNRLFKNILKFKNSGKNKEKCNLDHYYENFSNADRMIFKLEELTSQI